MNVHFEDIIVVRFMQAACNELGEYMEHGAPLVAYDTLYDMGRTVTSTKGICAVYGESRVGIEHL